MPDPAEQQPILSDIRAPARPRSSAPRIEYVLLTVAALCVLVIAWYAGWGTREPAPAAQPRVAAPAATAVAPAPASAASPAIRYPVPAEAAASSLPTLDESDVELARRLEEAIGHDAAAQLRSASLVRHIVATVDNLPRSHAPAAVWPVNPSAGRFQVDQLDGRIVIGRENEGRYLPFVSLAESVDMHRLAALYRSVYPLFQQAYEELGFPGKSFNDRLVDTIDSLLAAPEPEGPVAVELVRVEGSMPLARPWVHYTFADPQYEALPSGQKIMLRVGRANELRLKAQLKRLREALVPPQGPSRRE